MTTIKQRERRDWALLIFLVPIGIMLIIIVGQLAVRMVPTWSVDAGMGSNLEPDSDSARPFALLQPILPQILTPVAWAESYLTPNGDVSFPPFLTFEPTATPSPTAATPSPTESTPTATTTASPTSTVTVTVTSTPPTPTKTDTDEPDTPTPSATVSPSPPPTTPSPTTCTDPLANNQGQPLPCTFPPSICPNAHNPNGPLPCDYGTVSTTDPSFTLITPPPEVGVGLPNNTNPNDDSNIGYIMEGNYIVISLSVTVMETSDNNYDLALYEYNNNGSVNLDWIIIGISMSATGSEYYEVFNWGNGIPDTNTNVGDVAQTAGIEDDNHPIPVGDPTEVPPSETELYDPDYDPDNGTNGNLPQTGILIDVDANTTSSPPPGTYGYVVIISPNWVGSADPETQVDSIQTVEVPIPTP